MLNGTIKHGELAIEVAGDKPLRVVFRGKSNHRDPDAILRPLFHELMKKAGGSAAGLELHFEDLEFFNSSTITSVIHFIKELRTRNVTTRVTYDASHRWQKVFFDALTMLQKSDGFLQISAVTP